MLHLANYQFPLPFIPSRQGRGRIFVDIQYLANSAPENFKRESAPPARILHESSAATTDMAVLPGVLGCRPLRRTVQVRLGTNTLRLPGDTSIFAVSRRRFMKYPG
jgi:hypothetical protein